MFLSFKNCDFEENTASPTPGSFLSSTGGANFKKNERLFAADSAFLFVGHNKRKGLFVELYIAETRKYLEEPLRPERDILFSPAFILFVRFLKSWLLKRFLYIVLN